MKPILFVSGLARCGTSLTMQMLQAGGIECVGLWPAFEPKETNSAAGTIDPAWLRWHEGKAIKLLDPFRTTIAPGIDYAVIWLDRDTQQQARSQGKMVHTLCGMPLPDRAHRRRIAAALTTQRVSSLRKYDGHPVLAVEFEYLIRHDRPHVVERIAEFVATHHGAKLDTAAMRSCVLLRGPECMPDMSIELTLIAQRSCADSMRTA